MVWTGPDCYCCSHDVLFLLRLSLSLSHIVREQLAAAAVDRPCCPRRTHTDNLSRRARPEHRTILFVGRGHAGPHHLLAPPRPAPPRGLTPPQAETSEDIEDLTLLLASPIVSYLFRRPGIGEFRSTLMNLNLT